ncbi:cysteine-rich protein 2-binding protein isoform X2 [Nematostella vectensis]|uniref:cysteine-rich protein 2-binding protein isoform X2 n=1 Tax=Nematostella vectensis TaxID=45351 RepID=UPI0020775CFE|nr:cysteine-rich protein 2-binding protein isoform X2 [Nematostella vectensis]
MSLEESQCSKEKKDENEKVCYCHGPKEGDLIQCTSCQLYFHSGCLKSGRPSPLAGDVFFNLTCANCSDDGHDDCYRGNISWMQAVYLALYNLLLSGSGRKGYFRWKEDICQFIDRNWLLLFPYKRRSTSWCSTIAGTLSVGCPRYFKSGQQEFKESGWWSLKENISPVEVLNISGADAKKRKLPKKRTPEKRIQKSDPSPESTKRTSGEVGISDGILSNEDFTDLDYNTMMASLIGEEQPPLIAVSDTPAIMEVESLCSLIRGGVDEEQEDCDSSEDDDNDDDGGDDNDDNDDGNDKDNDNNDVASSSSNGFSTGGKHYSGSLPIGQSNKSLNDSLNDAPINTSNMNEPMDMSSSEQQEMQSSKTQLSTSSSDPRLENTTSTRQQQSDNADESKKTCAEQRVVPMTEVQEHELLCRLDACPLALQEDSTMRRLRRKLLLRKTKRDRALPLFDVDRIISQSLRTISGYAFIDGNVVPKKEDPSKLDSCFFEKSTEQKPSWTTHLSLGRKSNILDRFQAAPQMLHGQRRSATSFRHLLIGVHQHNHMRPFTSPYTSRMLKPYIRRDFESRPLKLRLMEELMERTHRGQMGWKPQERRPIDYCYVQPHHIPSVNAMCREFFWPGIDLSECLQYPDFSCVVLYRCYVIGFAFMVPDVKYNEAYISFILVHPEWQHAGIGSYMLYHLIQTCMGKDVTLHVSATNSAMLLYQRFGFKPEEFIINFYERYLPANSPQCPHAFFLRLRR